MPDRMDASNTERMRHMTTYTTYPQNYSRLPVRILNELVTRGQLEELPIDGDSTLKTRRTKPWPRTVKEWAEHAGKTDSKSAH